MAVGDFFKVRVGVGLNAQVGYNIWHFVVVSETLGGVTDTEVANQIQTDYNNLFVPMLTNAGLILAGGAQYLGPLAARLEQFSTGAQASGSAGANPLPQQVAGLAILQTGGVGRSKRGFKYMPFPDEADNVGSPDESISAGYLVNFSLFLGNFIPSWVVTGVGGTATMNPVLDKTDQVTYRKITTWKINPHWSQQKRRSQLRRPDAPFPPP